MPKVPGMQLTMDSAYCKFPASKHKKSPNKRVKLLSTLISGSRVTHYPHYIFLMQVLGRLVPISGKISTYVPGWLWMWTSCQQARTWHLAQTWFPAQDQNVHHFIGGKKRKKTPPNQIIIYNVQVLGKNQTSKSWISSFGAKPAISFNFSRMSIGFPPPFTKVLPTYLAFSQPIEHFNKRWDAEIVKKLQNMHHQGIDMFPFRNKDQPQSCNMDAL